MQPRSLSGSGGFSRAKGAAVIGVSAAVGTGAWQHHHRKQHAQPPAAAPTRWLPTSLVDATAGAVGEIVNILALYPLETVKVRCQAEGVSARQVLMTMAASTKNPVELMRALYAGALGAAACAILVGAVHFTSYEGSRRWLTDHLPSDTPQSSQPGAQSHPASHSKGLVNALASLTAGVYVPGEQGGSGNHSGSQDDGSGGGVVLCSAVLSAVITAIVESPIELFRHQQQAGMVQGNFLREMVSAVRRDGPAGLYWGFLPHCFEALPHDVSEMLVIGCLKDLQTGMRPGSTHHGWISRIPLEAFDLAAGAASGAAAVLVSTPFDTIKTYLQTHGAELGSKGLIGSAKLFLDNGKRMVQKKGVGALYYGLAPRLLQQVPSSMLCWWAVHATVRTLAPWTTLPAVKEPPPVVVGAVPTVTAPRHKKPVRGVQGQADAGEQKGQ